MFGIEFEVTPLLEWLLGAGAMGQPGIGLESSDALGREILVALLQAPFQSLDQTCISISTTLLASGLLMLAQHVALRMGRLALRMASRLFGVD